VGSREGLERLGFIKGKSAIHIARSSVVSQNSLASA